MNAKILFYASRPEKFPTEITCINSFSYSNACTFLPVYNGTYLSDYMQNSEKNEMIAILTATSEEEMTDLVLMKDLFDTIPIILIISDESDSMVHKAHKLRPRFLATFDDDFNSILSVVENLVKDLQQKQLLSRV